MLKSTGVKQNMFECRMGSLVTATLCAVCLLASLNQSAAQGKHTLNVQ